MVFVVGIAPRAQTIWMEEILARRREGIAFDAVETMRQIWPGEATVAVPLIGRLDSRNDMVGLLLVTRQVGDIFRPKRLCGLSPAYISLGY